MAVNKVNKRSRGQTDADVVRRLLTECNRVGSQAEWAKLNGFNRSFLSNVVSGRRGVSERLARALGFVRADGWVKVEDASS